MNIILIDSNSTRVSEHAQLLHQLGHTAWKWDVNVAVMGIPNIQGSRPQPSPPPNYDFALVHASDFQGLASAAPNCKYVAIYSGGGSPSNPTHPCINRPVNSGSPIPMEALSQICSLVKTGSPVDAWKRRIEELFNFEPLLAYRLLRQAQVFCGDEESKHFPESGLLIHAPMTLDHWLEPFKSTSSSGLKELADLIVSEDTSEAAQGVKDAVSSNRDLETEVRKYLKAS